MATETPKEERIFTIPLRPIFQRAPIYKRSARAIHAVKQFIAHHMKVDADTVRVGISINNEIFKRGRKHPPTSVKARVWKEENKIRAELPSVQRPEVAKEEKSKEKPEIVEVAKSQEESTIQKVEEEKKEVLVQAKPEKHKEKRPQKEAPPKEAKLDRIERSFPHSQKPKHEKQKVGR